MPILTIVLVLIVIGIVMWAVNSYIPMESNIKKIMNVVVIITIILWLLKIFGIWDFLTRIHT